MSSYNKRYKSKPTFVLHNKLDSKLPNLKTKTAISKSSLDKLPPKRSYFSNACQSFSTDELALLDITNSKKDDTVCLEKCRNQSRVEIAKEKLMTIQRVNTDESKEVCHVSHVLDEDSLFSPRRDVFLEEEEKNENIVTKQSKHEKNSFNSESTFIPDLKNHIMTYAGDHHKEGKKLNECRYSFGETSEAIENKSVGRRRVSRTVGYYSMNDRLSMKTHIKPEMYNLFSVNEMEKHLFTNGMQVPAMLTTIVQSRK